MYLQATVYDESGPGAVIAAAVFNTLLTPLLRLPVRATMATTIGVIGSAIGWLTHEVAGPDVTFATAVPYYTFALSAVPMVIGAAVVGESLLRAKYVDEQVIGQQQAQLADAHRLIRRYAPPAVADAIDHGEGTSVDAPQRRRVTVLFSDVVGFTDLADRLDPEGLTQVVNEYLAALAEIIERHRGTLNEFAGDGVMAIFGAPIELDPEEQVGAAVAAAREIHSVLPELNRTWMKLGVDRELQTRIGINTGVLSVGSFGSEGRATYTGIGLQTNIAARIQSQCEPGGTLLSHSSWQLVKDTVACESRGEVTVKGVHFPIAVFALPPRGA
jgi:class 3 adenylate cyclase